MYSEKKETTQTQFKPLPKPLREFKKQLEQNNTSFPVTTNKAIWLFDGMMTPHEAFRLMNWAKKTKILEPIQIPHGRMTGFRYDLDRILVLAQMSAILGKNFSDKINPEIVFGKLKAEVAETRLGEIVGDPAGKLIFRGPPSLPPYSSSLLERLGDLDIDKILALKELTNSWDKSQPLLRSGLISELRNLGIGIESEFLDTLVYLDGIAIKKTAVSYSMCTKGDFIQAVDWCIHTISENMGYDLTLSRIIKKIEVGIRLKLPKV